MLLFGQNSQETKLQQGTLGPAVEALLEFGLKADSSKNLSDCISSANCPFLLTKKPTEHRLIPAWDPAAKFWAPSFYFSHLPHSVQRVAVCYC